MSGEESFQQAGVVISDKDLQSRLKLIRHFVARSIPTQPFEDSTPALIPFHENDDGIGSDFPSNGNGNIEGFSGGGIIIGSARHAANIPLLQSMNVVAVLNCASGGIARLPVDKLEECGIRYAFTNCRQDSYSYPILHEKKKISKKDHTFNVRYVCSQHLEISNALFADIRRENASRDGSNARKKAGNVLFFCVAGQNRSAALATATMMLHGKPLEKVLEHFSRQRPFVLENVGFQQQLVELEAILRKLQTHGVSQLFREQFSTHWGLLQYACAVSIPNKKVRILGEDENEELVPISAMASPLTPIPRSESEFDVLAGNKVEIELLIPGLCTMEVRIPTESTISEVKKCLIEHANNNLLRHDQRPAKVAKAWVILAMFGYDDMYDIPLEVEAVELKVQLERMQSMFGLKSVLKGEMYTRLTCSLVYYYSF